MIAPIFFTHGASAPPLVPAVVKPCPYPEGEFVFFLHIILMNGLRKIVDELPWHIHTLEFQFISQ